MPWLGSGAGYTRWATGDTSPPSPAATPSPWAHSAPSAPPGLDNSRPKTAHHNTIRQSSQPSNATTRGGRSTAPDTPPPATAPSCTPQRSNASTPAAPDCWKRVTKPPTTNGIHPGDAMTDKSRTAHARSERGARTDAPTMSEGGVEIDVPDHYRLPRETNRALVQAILAVRDRMLTSDRGVA